MIKKLKIKTTSILEKLKKIKIQSIIMPVLALGTLIGTINCINSKNYGLALEYKGKTVAAVKNEEIYEEATDIIRHEFSKIETTEERTVKLPEPEIKLVSIENCLCCETVAEVRNKIVEHANDVVNDGAGIYSDGEFVCAAENEDILNSILEKIKKDVAPNEGEIAEFIEKIEIIKGLFAPEEIRTPEEIEGMLKNGIVENIEYTVLENDKIENIAEDFGISVEELLKQNNKENIAPGDVLKIQAYLKFLNIRVTKEITEDIEISFRKIKEQDYNLEAGKKVTKQKGKNGKEKAIFKISTINGEEVEKIKISGEIIEAPTDEIVTCGKKVVIKEKKKESKKVKQEINTNSDKSFIWPVPYTHNVTSNYGWRGRQFHKGMDIAAKGIGGEPIVAAMSGTVEIASNRGDGYGNQVFIRHDNGMKTRYAHAKSLKVSSGSKVKQGQEIAFVGDTGNSHGKHCHFEIIDEKGNAKNPKNYVR